MAKPVLSRHFLAESLYSIASVPFAAPASNERGSSVAHNILACGSWSEDSQEHRVTILDVAVGYSNGEANTPAVNRLASFQHMGAIVALNATELGDGLVLLTTASSDGTICRLRMTVPLIPGSTPDGIHLTGEDLEAALLKTYSQPHTCAITAMDTRQESNRSAAVLTAGADGSLVLTQTAAAQPTVDVIQQGTGAALYQHVQWASAHTFYTASLQGAVQLFDIRSRGKAALTLIDNNSSAAMRLAVNPAQTFLCGAGYSDGIIKIWDTRSSAATVSANIGSRATGMQFVSGEGHYRQSPLVYATSKGVVGLMDASTGATRSIYEDPAGMTDLIVSSIGSVNQIFAATQHEGLVFIANGL